VRSDVANIDGTLLVVQDEMDAISTINPDVRFVNSHVAVRRTKASLVAIILHRQITFAFELKSCRIWIS
jgi:hypothetical protein